MNTDSFELRDDDQAPPRPRVVGRGAQANFRNRFDKTHCEPYHGDSGDDWWIEEESRKVETQLIPDDSKSIITENNSPDLQFRYSLNPYRGCSHGCSYCYARTYHEYLSLSGGLDFETKIIYKPQAAQLFQQWLDRPSWRGEPITLSGATDCYQTCEQQLQLTRSCLAVALKARQPLSLITKNALVVRDIDLLSQLAEHALIRVSVSVTSLDSNLIRQMEPRTSSPAARLRAIRQLTAAGIPTRAVLSPIIPGLTDHEIPSLMQAVAEAGAWCVESSLLRLPGVVQDVFFDWVTTVLPAKLRVIESRLRQVRGGTLNDSQFHSRLQGQGPLAQQIAQTVRVFAKKYQLDRELPPLDSAGFRPPREANQLWLFE